MSDAHISGGHVGGCIYDRLLTGYDVYGYDASDAAMHVWNRNEIYVATCIVMRFTVMCMLRHIL